MPVQSLQVVQPHNWGSGIVRKGQLLKVSCATGGQVGDFVSLNSGNHEERLDCLYSQLSVMRWQLRPGDVLVTNMMRPMWTIMEDTAGDNYTGGGMCNRAARITEGLSPVAGCQETIEAAFTAHEIPVQALHQVSCFNLFMHVRYLDDGTLHFGPSRAKAGDYITLRAEMDNFWAVSVCIWPGISAPGYSSMRFETLE